MLLTAAICCGCGSEGGARENGPLAGAFFAVERMAGGNYEEVLKGCTAVLPPEQWVDGSDATRFGRNPTGIEPSSLEVVHETDARGLAVTIYFDGSVVDEKHYTLEFLKSGVDDRFELLAGATQYRFTYHGEADCEP